MVSVHFKHFNSLLLSEGKQFVLWSEGAAINVFRTSMRLPGSDTVATYTGWSKVQTILAHNKKQELVQDV